MNYHSGEKLKLNKNQIETRSKSAFTLLEMIVSISLIVIITAIFIANYRSNNKRTDLIMTAQTLVGNLHAAQNNTLGLIKYGDQVPAGGWGIYFDTAKPTQYVLFADLNRSASDEPGNTHDADDGYMSYNSDSSDSAFEGDVNLGARIIDLPAGIEISSISLDNNTPLAAVNVTFLPPDPQTNIFDGLNTHDAIRVSLKDIRDNTIKTVRINFLGLIEVVEENFAKHSF